RRIVGVPLLLVGVIVLSGCGSGRPREKTVKLHNPKGIDAAKAVLQRYAGGSPLASEAMSFPQIVQEVKESDPGKGAILEKGFADLQKAKGNLAPKAKDLLTK